METSDTAVLLKQISALTSRVAELEEATAKQKARFGRFRKTSLALAGGVGLLFAGAALAVTYPGNPLYQYMHFSTATADTSFLDSGVIWDRVDPAGFPVGHTNEILSLVTEATKVN